MQDEWLRDSNQRSRTDDLKTTVSEYTDFECVKTLQDGCNCNYVPCKSIV
jgi:hypothetical protein